MARIILSVIISLFLFIAVYSRHSGMELHGYLLLISNVHEYYKTSCIMFVHPRDYGDVNVTSLVQAWSFELSRKGIFTVGVTISKLAAETERYRQHIVRPLYVVLLDTQESMDELTVTIKYMNIAYPVWFLIFLQQPGKPLENACLHPTDNLLPLTFNTEMLVLCYNRPNLNEWYAIRDNRTRVYSLATWTPEKGLTLLTRKSLYGRRSNMLGQTLRVATVQESPFAAARNGVLTKFLGDVVVELSKVMNCKLEVLDSVESYGSYSQEDQHWTGVVGQLVEGKADLGVAEFTVTNRRLEVVDFTLPLLLSRNRLYFKQPDDSTVQWSGYFKAFSTQVWAAIVFIIIFAPILLTVIKTRGCIIFKVITENYIHVWGIYCQQGLSEFPSESSLRLAFLSIFVSALIVSSAYSASLISFLTLHTVSLPFTTINDFADDGTYQLITFRNSADYDMFVTAKDTVLVAMRKLMKEKQKLPFGLMEGFEQTCKEKVGFYTTEVMKNAISIYLPCEIVFIETGRADSLAMALPKDSPYTGLINFHLQRFQDNGILNRLRNKYFVTPNPMEKNYTTVELWGILPILAVLAGGTVLSSFILLIERVYFMLKNERKERCSPLRGFQLDNITESYKKLARKGSRKIVKMTKKCDVKLKKSVPHGYWP